MESANDDRGSRAPRTPGAPRPSGTALLVALALAAGLALTGTAHAQEEAPACTFRSPASELADRASPPDSSSIQLSGGTVKVCYGSPKVRGREIFGGLVPYGQPWRLGANEPTTLHTTVSLSVGGVRVEPGSYSLYAVPGAEEWQIVVNAATDRWGIPINEQVRARDVGSTTASPRATDESVGSLRIRLEHADGGEARLSIAWATTRLEVPVTVPGEEPEEEG